MRCLPPASSISSGSHVCLFWQPHYPHFCSTPLATDSFFRRGAFAVFGLGPNGIRRVFFRAAGLITRMPNLVCRICTICVGLRANLSLKDCRVSGAVLISLVANTMGKECVPCLLPCCSLGNRLTRHGPSLCRSDWMPAHLIVRPSRARRYPKAAILVERLAQN